jgi:hypothetical protein
LPPERVEIELAKCGTTIRDLVHDLYDVPELRDVLERLSSEEARQRLALEYFGDEGHPQPREREPVALMYGLPAAVYGDRTPDWGRLPRLEAGEQAPRPRAAGELEQHGESALAPPAQRVTLDDASVDAIARRRAELDEIAKQPKSRRGPIRRSKLEKAVELLVKHKQATGGYKPCRNDVARETGLSTRVVDGLILDLKAHTGLGWTEEDRLVLPEGTRTTPDGVILPERG